MTMSKRTLLLAAGALALAGCASPEVSDYRAEKPVLDLQRYFDGRVHAWGTFTDRSGKVVRRFTVVVDCSWNGNDGTLDEAFLYSDGSRQRRVWKIHKEADGQYTGRADDVVGEARGLASGNALRWNYTLELPVDGKVWQVQMDDWMYRIDDDVMLNRTTMSKFGITLGQVTLFFSRKP